MIKTIAIDDEPLALQLVKGYISKTPFLELAASFDNPLDAMDYLHENEADLIFLDIQMPDLTGTEFTRILGGSYKIIFTTAYEKYALEAFNYEEFLIAAQKAEKLIRLENADKVQEITANNDFLFLKSEYKIRRINFKEIRYIEGLKDYVKVYLVNETLPVMSLSTLKSLEEKLPKSRFMRVHRSFIVNLEKIDTIERSRIVFGKVYIPVSDQYKEQFQEYIDKNFL
jgi:two-component system response regulator LytT